MFLTKTFFIIRDLAFIKHLSSVLLLSLLLVVTSGCLFKLILIIMLWPQNLRYGIMFKNKLIKQNNNPLS